MSIAASASERGAERREAAGGLVMSYFFLTVVPAGLRRMVDDTCESPAMESYQDDFVTPGSSPACAISRKQMRHRPNLR